MPIRSDILRDVVDALKAALAAERSARQQAEARASGAEAMVAHLKLVIAKVRRERFGPSAEHGSKLLDQLELQLEELEASATEDELAATARSGEDGTVVTSFTRKKPVRAPLPEHLPRERVVIPVPAACPCCGGRLAKLGEDVTARSRRSGQPGQNSVGPDNRPSSQRDPEWEGPRNCCLGASHGQTATRAA